MMSDNQIFRPTAETATGAHIDVAGYQEMYQRSLTDSDGFWAEHGKRIDWIKPYSKISSVSYDKSDLHIRWYEDGSLNAAANCLDRHLADRGEQTAIVWEGDDPDQHNHISYNALHAEV